MTTVDKLLIDLGWPADACDRRGTLLWSASNNNDATPGAISASVLVDHDTIKARVRSALVGQPGLEPLLEAAWRIEGLNVRLTDLTVNGQPAAPDQSAALGAFHDHVNQMGVRPQFQGFAPRRPTQTATPKTP